ncbi:MAG: HAMP domain-containing histidine kinase [Clostridium sp.]|nr:HAMP domain-containing histidine kinase [Clostridium sp.]
MKRKPFKIKRKMKKANFYKIWIAIALPILTASVIALVLVSNVLMIGLLFSGELRVIDVAYETAAAFQGEALGSFEENSKKLNLEQFQMVAAIYDEQGNLMGESEAANYEEDLDISAKQYCLALEKLKKMQFNEKHGIPGFDEVAMFGISYLYGRQYFMADGKIYSLCYGALMFPWVRHGKRLLTGGALILSGVLALTFFIAQYYYKIYRERVRAEEYYRNTSNALAHDLKTPLMAISGYAEILQENVHTEKRDYYAAGILKNVAVMNGLIENMLELARLENPKIILSKEDINLRELTEEILEQFQTEIDSKEIGAAIQGAADIWADRTLIRRALENLIGNAVKYTPKGNRIVITMDTREYQIKNTGVMIAEEELSRLWEPFVKGNNARTNAEGAGIGLTIVKEILEKHGFESKITNAEDGMCVTIKYM